jgi:hypothetical protein
MINRYSQDNIFDEYKRFSLIAEKTRYDELIEDKSDPNRQSPREIELRDRMMKRIELFFISQQSCVTQFRTSQEK